MRGLSASDVRFLSADATAALAARAALYSKRLNQMRERVPSDWSHSTTAFPGSGSASRGAEAS
jgi:hypothetical protein